MTEPKIIERVITHDVVLRGGPAAGGHVLMPAGGAGEFVIHNLPFQLEYWEDERGEEQCTVIAGGGTTDQTTGEPLGSMVYEIRDVLSGEAHYVRSDHNPVTEDNDADLEILSPYLDNVAVTYLDNVAVTSPPKFIIVEGSGPGGCA